MVRDNTTVPMKLEFAHGTLKQISRLTHTRIFVRYQHCSLHQLEVRTGVSSRQNLVREFIIAQRPQNERKENSFLFFLHTNWLARQRGS